MYFSVKKKNVRFFSFFLTAVLLLILTACGTIVKYKLNFIVEGDIYYTIDTTGEEIITMPEDPEKDNYVFDGWYFDKDIWNKPFTINSLLTEKLTSDMSVYAHWILEDITKQDFTVTFNSRGGSEVPSQLIRYNSLVMLPEEPVRLGYIFSGWYKDPSNLEKWDFNTDVVKSNLTLYAKWADENDANGCDIINAEGMTINNLVLSSKVPNSQTHLSLSDIITVSPYATYKVTSDIAGLNEIPSGTIELDLGDNTYYILVTSGTGSNKKQYEVNVHRNRIFEVRYVLNNGLEDIVEDVEEGSYLVEPNYTRLGYYAVKWQYLNLTWDFNTMPVLGDMVLNLIWEADKYEIAFDSDGGTAIENAEVTNDSHFEFSVPLKDGYEFQGWETDTGTIITDNQGAGITNWHHYYSTTLKATWSAKTYKIIYEGIEAAVNNNPATYTIEDNTIVLEDAIKTGYTFQGWFVGDQQYNEITTGSFGDLTLEARWTPTPHKIVYLNTFDVENPNPKEYTIEDLGLVLQNINRTGYSLNGWYLDNQKVTSISEYYGDITLTAKWDLVEFNINYLNTKSVENENPLYYNIETDNLILKDISADGYKFLGWYNGEDIVTEITAGNTGDITLTAQWELLNYQINYLNTENADNSNPLVYTIEDNIIFSELVREHYEFDGWYKNDTKITEISEGTFGDLTLTAKWSPRLYNISYLNTMGADNLNPNLYTVEDETIILSDIDVLGYKFDGWYLGDERIVEIASGTTLGDLALTARWKTIEYSITYILNGGEYQDEQNPTSYNVESEIVFVSPIKNNYVFDGWYTEENGEERLTGINSGTTGDKKFYARWIYISTISFESNGGNEVDSITNPAGTTISTPVAPVRDHYIFNGWFKDKELTQNFAFNYMPETDITLYAKWSPWSYNISYVLNDGVNDAMNPSNYTIESNLSILPATKTGFTFDGWFSDPSFTSPVIQSINPGTFGDLVLYAKFTVNQYTLTFDTKGGSEIDALTLDFGSELTAPEPPTKTGYTFAGWYSDENYSEKFIFDIVEAQDITIYAKWNIITYKITYHLDGGTSQANPKTYTIESDKIIFNNAEKKGYIFRGWFTTSDFSSEPVIEISTGSSGDLNLYAKWELEYYTITYILPDGANHENAGSYSIQTSRTYLKVATMPGYNFSGWYNDSNYTSSVSYYGNGEIGDKVFYARFRPNNYYIYLNGSMGNPYTVSFNLNGGSGNIENQYISGNIIQYPEIPTRNNYLFAGWYTTADCTGAPYDFDAKITEDLNLYAKWVSSVDYLRLSVGKSVNLALQGTTFKKTMFAPLVSGNITLTTIGNIDTFAELYDANNKLLARSDDNGDNLNFSITYNVTAGQVYYLHVRGLTSSTNGTVQLSILGESVPTPKGTRLPTSYFTVSYDNEYIIPMPSNREGFEFLGWYDADGNQYTDNTGRCLVPYTHLNDIILYSKWNVLSYNISFVTNGGTSVDSTNLNYGERLDINQFTTVRNGYSFAGWYFSSYDTQPYNAKNMPAEDITLYAKWVTYSLQTIKYDTDKKYVSSINGPNAELFDPLCIDTDGNFATFTTSYSGELIPGSEITLRLIATNQDGSKVKQITINDVKVYGAPTLSFNSSIQEIGYRETYEGNIFNASGLDTFGQPTLIRVYTEDDNQPGNTVKIIIEAIDKAGNITSNYIENVKIYGNPEITYSDENNKLNADATISVETFNGIAQDSFGNPNPLKVSVGFVDGYVHDSRREENNFEVFLALDTETYSLFYKNQNSSITMIYITCQTTNTHLKTVYAYPGSSYIENTFDVIAGYSYSIYYVNNVTDVRFSMYLESQSKTLNLSNLVGNTVDVVLTAEDRFNNFSKVIIPVGVYGEPIIFDANVTDFKVSEVDSINVDKLEIRATDSLGLDLDIMLELISGSGIAGSTMEFLATAVDCLGNTSTKQIVVKIYDSPTIEVGRTAVKHDEVINASSFKAKAYDSFGNPIAVTFEYLEGEQIAGNYLKYKFTATDKASNTIEKIVNFAVLDQADIILNYFEMASDFIKLTSNGEEFSAYATDSFGEFCQISFESETGIELVGGTIANIYIVATDRAGNTVRSNLIRNIKIYDMPEAVLLLETYAILVNQDISFLFNVYDSFGEELFAYITTNDSITVGNYITITVRATDNAGNELIQDYQFAVYSSEKTYVELYVDDIKWDFFFVEDSNNYSLPQYHKDGQKFVGWKDAENKYFSYEDGIGLIGLSGAHKLHAVFCDIDFTPIFNGTQLSSISLSGKYILFRDINLYNTEFTPIGTSESPFTGIFDGNGFTISNYSITTVTPYDGKNSSRYVGLFGVNKGTIKNLGVKNVNIDIVSASFIVYVGALVGSNHGIIDNCYSTGLVKIQINGTSTLGGLVGSAENTSIITNSYSSANVVYFSGGSWSIGGFVGSNYGTIENCYSTGNVTGEGGSRSFSVSNSTGGFVGVNTSNGIIRSSYSRSIVKSITTNSYSSGSINTGGFGGVNLGVIENCYSNSSIETTVHYVVYVVFTASVGGFVGSNRNRVSKSYAISNNITVSFYGSYTPNNKVEVGGLVGRNTSIVNDCYNYFTSINVYANVNVTCDVGYVVGNNTATFSNNYYTQVYINRPASSSQDKYLPTNNLGTLNSGNIYDENLFKNILNWSDQIWTFGVNTDPILKWQK